MSLASGTRLGPYEIAAQIGAGGMGEVYKATDTRLGRTVAIKTMNADHLARFEREARAIASLNHPHICQLYDVGPNFLVMEFIDGGPLVPEDATEPIPLARALRYATQIAGALEAAHAKGITHRDLKPANILVTPSGVKLLDFGLAKQDHVPATNAETITIEKTQAGTILGTAAYMSPEQADGRPADARSDIFSFGAVFYEMLSGRRAFSGVSAVATMGAIIYKDPEPLNVSPAVEAIVARCLRKSPAERFQSAAALQAALNDASATLSAAHDTPASGVPIPSVQMPWLSSSTSQSPTLNVAPKLPSIAVLPFANIGQDADNEYFSDGLAEELIGALSQIEGLKVIARTSAFAFKGKNEDVRKIAETLGVTNILEGGVRRAGNRVRVTAQLIQATDGTQLWSQRYDREMTDVFAIQDEISQAIAAQLKVSLAGNAAAHRQTANLAAYEAVLRGRHELNYFTPVSLERAKQSLDYAISIDPDYAFAHASLAEYYIGLATAGTARPSEAFPLAEAAANRALEIDPTVAEAHSALGLVSAAWKYDWTASDRHYLRALESNPAAAGVHFSRGYWCLRPSGRLNEAMAEIECALELDPLSTYFRFGRSYVSLFIGQDDVAAEGAKLTFDLDPSYFLGYFVLSYVRARQGRFDEAISLAERMVELHGRWPMSLLVLGTVYGMSGKREAAESVLRELEGESAKGYVSDGALAIVNATLGNMDDAFHWAERAIASHDTQILSFKTSPAYAEMRKDPRSAALLAKMNLA